MEEIKLGLNLTLTEEGRRVVLEKVSYHNARIGKKDLAEIEGRIKATKKKCSCGSPMFCIPIFSGTIDAYCSFFHICLNPDCQHQETHHTHFLKKDEEPICCLCQEEPKAVLSEG